MMKNICLLVMLTTSTTVIDSHVMSSSQTYRRQFWQKKQFTQCDDVDNMLDNTCEVIRQETVLFSTPETDYIIYD